MMGFGLETAKKGLIKVKNESVSAAIDAIEEITKLEKDKEPKLPVKKMKIISWQCPTCTYINAEGKEICEMCTSGVPDQYRIPDNDEEDIKKQKDEEEKKK